MASLYTLGNFTIDDIVLHDGRCWIDQPGGNALYSALGAGIWHTDVGLIARVGNDLPVEYRRSLDSLDIEFVLTYVDSPNIHNWALYEPDGSRQFVLHRSSGEFDDMCIRGEEISAKHRRGRAYHVAPMPTPRQIELVRTLAGDPVILSLDPHEEFIYGYEDELLDVLPLVDLFLPSREEARRLHGRDDPEAAMREFAKYGPSVTAVKLGADGSLVYESAVSRLTYVPIYPTDVADVTGAGDAYCGGFLAGYLSHGDAVRAACCGTVSASYIIEGIGALQATIPSSSDAKERLHYVQSRVKESR